MLTPIKWSEKRLKLLDQRKLPHTEQWVYCNTVAEVCEAIEEMVVRGAPAIGLTAAYGMALAARKYIQCNENNEKNDAALRGGISARREQLMNYLMQAAENLQESRPTAVNLQWAVRKQLGNASEMISDELATSEIYSGLLSSAKALHEEDIEINKTLSEYGEGLFRDGDQVLTHCNAGALATGGFGTALGVIRHAHKQGTNLSVYVTETRPFLQGARLTTWEMVKCGIPIKLIVDSAAGLLIQQGQIDAVVVGADRIVANGDTANKIGTYNLALAANRNAAPFYVAAPTSTLDLELPDSSGIQIEKRSEREVTHWDGSRTAPEMVAAENYAFDITPADLITAFITEQGLIEPPFTDGLRCAWEKAGQDR